MQRPRHPIYGCRLVLHPQHWGRRACVLVKCQDLSVWHLLGNSGGQQRRPRPCPCQKVGSIYPTPWADTTGVSLRPRIIIDLSFQRQLRSVAGRHCPSLLKKKALPLRLCAKLMLIKPATSLELALLLRRPCPWSLLQPWLIQPLLHFSLSPH